MKLRLDDKRKAVELRRKGYTYSEIRSNIPDLSKGTLSGWLKNIELDSKQRKRILSKITSGAEKGRLKGAWTNKQKSADRILKIQETARSEFAQYDSNPLFKVFLSLYWAEGAKKSRGFQFVNSDPEMIRICLKCLRELFNIPESDIGIRLYIHKIYESENCEMFWSEVSDIPVNLFQKTVFKPSVHSIKKNPAYKGCCRIDISGSNFYWKVEQWIKMLIETI